MDRQNSVLDQYAHSHLKGKIFKRKGLDPYKLKGLGYLGISALSYSKFSVLALHFGHTLPFLGIVGTALAGMTNLTEGNKINSIEWVKDGEHKGKLKFNVSTGPFTSKDLLVATNDAQGVLSLNNDDAGEEDLETNLVQLTNFIDCSSGNIVDQDTFTLPADGFKDHNVLDWVLSIKNADPSLDSTHDLFNDLMIEQYDSKAQTGGLSYLGFLA